jgi:predicted negative regulator of RcsB-dependent stress response
MRGWLVLLKKLKNLKRKEEQLGEKSRHVALAFSLIFLFLQGFSNSSTKYFNKELFSAHKAVYELRLNDALVACSQYQDSYSSGTYYIRTLSLALRAFITEKPTDIKAFEDAKSRALDVFDELADNDPYKNIFLAETYFYSAIVKAKQDQLYSAARDIGRAHSLLSENINNHPNFIGSYKTKGIMQVYLSTVPEHYQWAVKLLGFNGDLKKGLKNLERLVHYQGDDEFLKNLKIETHYMYAFALHHVAKQPQKAWDEVVSSTLDYETNLLSSFFRASLATKLHKNTIAIQTIRKAPHSAAYEKLHYLQLLLGQNLLYQQDPASLECFETYLAEYTGQVYKKACLRYLSWYYVLNGNTSKALHYKNRILSTGNAINEDDKAAQHYSTKDLPNPHLLKARIQYDGGLYKKASQTLDGMSSEQLSKNQKAEYSYRQGRVHEKLGRMDVAVKYYKACSLFAEESTEYYGPYACLYLGDYYRQTGNKVQAEIYYKKAQTYKNNKEYKSSIEQRSKLGLKLL